MSVPDDLQGTLKSKVASIARQTSRLLAVKALQEKAKLPLAEAKAITFHIASDKERCHRCNSVLPEEEITYCAKCRSLNLNW